MDIFMMFFWIFMGGIGIFLLLLLAIMAVFRENFYYVINGEVLTDDRKMVKEKTAVYIKCDTYMTLNAANKEKYPLPEESNNCDRFFRFLRESYNIVFKPLEAIKLINTIEKIEEDKKAVKYEEIRQINHKKACKNVEDMLKTVQDYSSEKNKELNKSLEDNLIKTEKMIRGIVEKGRDEDAGIPMGGI